jgi:hypothetical protein
MNERGDLIETIQSKSNGKIYFGIQLRLRLFILMNAPEARCRQ